jgi:hypothetical protein
VTVDRRKAAASALFCALFVWSGAGWMVLHGSIPGLFVALVMAPVAWTNARDAYVGTVKLVIDAKGMTYVRGGARLAWSEIVDIRIDERQSFDLIRSLVVTADPARLAEHWTTPRTRLKRPPPDGELHVLLNRTRPGWQAVVRAIETYSGRTVERPPKRQRWVRAGRQRTGA